jgi:putative sigma-54 modulation protein
MNQKEMQVRIDGRHVSVTQPIKDYAQKKLESIGIDFPRIIDVHIILEVEKYRHRCEIILHCTNHIHIEASEESDNMYASIDVCMDKLTRQMRKFKTKIQRHHRHRKQQVVHVEEQILSADGLDDHEAAEPKITHKEQFAIKPMFPDEAVLQLELSPKQFLVFLNPTTDQVNVLYRKKRGDYGLIEANVARMAI